MLRACYRHAANALTVHPGAEVDTNFCALTDRDNLRKSERDQSRNGAANAGGKTCYLGAPCRKWYFRCFSLERKQTWVSCEPAVPNCSTECTRFYNGDRALKVKRWLHRVAEDASGLTFEEWDPTKDVDNSQPPVAMIINSSELRGAGFNLQEVIPPALEAAARSGRRTRGAGVRQVEGLGRKRFVLSADDDNDLRSRCE